MKKKKKKKERQRRGKWEKPTWDDWNYIVELSAFFLDADFSVTEEVGT